MLMRYPISVIPVCLSLLFAFLAACQPAPGESGASGPANELDWRGVNDFLYQLQNTHLQAIGETKYDLLVIDYSSDGTAEGELSAAQIAALKSSPGGRKLVLAYMSIGEAEDYRYYWKPEWEPGNPEWLDIENPDWPGNYKVKYWHPDWQRIIFGSPDAYLDKIIGVNCDGVYLDLVDAYEYYADTRLSAEQEMVDFVLTITNYARVVRGRSTFGVFCQNGEGLYYHPEYMRAVTGIGREGTYYGYEADN